MIEHVRWTCLVWIRYLDMGKCKVFISRDICSYFYSKVPPSLRFMSKWCLCIPLRTVTMSALQWNFGRAKIGYYGIVSRVVTYYLLRLLIFTTRYYIYLCLLLYTTSIVIYYYLLLSTTIYYYLLLFTTIYYHILLYTIIYSYVLLPVSTTIYYIYLHLLHLLCLSTVRIFCNHSAVRISSSHFA